MQLWAILTVSEGFRRYEADKKKEIRVPVKVRRENLEDKRISKEVYVNHDGDVKKL